MMINNVNIRVCSIGDETTLSLLGQATFLESFAGLLDGGDILNHCANKHSSIIYRDWLEKDNVTIWIAEVNPGNAPVGYSVLTPPDLPIADPRIDDIEVKRIYFLRPFQGVGLGKRLMEEALSYANRKNYHRVLLGVHSRNTGAIAFYKKIGFVNVGTRKFKVGNSYYDDIVLALNL
jgi:diamine N-acetyltransferase